MPRQSVQGQHRIREHLTQAGIFSCNDNPWLPSFSDVGCTMGDMAALLARQELFFTKAYRSRSVYLSVEAYFLLKACFVPSPSLPWQAQRLYSYLESGPAETPAVKQAAALSSSDFAKGLGFLLENLMITAISGGREINPNWFSLIYCTAAHWEKSLPPERRPKVPSEAKQAEAALKALLSPLLSPREVERMMFHDKKGSQF